MGDEVRGLDLVAHAEDVRRIVVAVVGARAQRASVELDDLLQQVYLRIALANRGDHPYEPARASMSRYVVLQAHSALSNIIASRRARRRKEILGAQQDWALPLTTQHHDQGLDEWLSLHLPGLAPEERRALHAVVAARDWRQGRQELGEEAWGELAERVAEAARV